MSRHPLLLLPHRLGVVARFLQSPLRDQIALAWWTASDQRIVDAPISALQKRHLRPDAREHVLQGIV